MTGNGTKKHYLVNAFSLLSSFLVPSLPMNSVAKHHNLKYNFRTNLIYVSQIPDAETVASYMPAQVSELSIFDSNSLSSYYT